VNFKCVYVKTENDKKSDAFSSFDALLFPKRKKYCTNSKKICTVCEDGIVTKNTIRKWFVWFKSDNFNLKDRERFGRHAVVDDDQM